MCQDPKHLFSLIPDPDQNKGDPCFVSAVAYGVDIRLSCPIQFRLLPNQNFVKNAQDPADPAGPWIQDPSGGLPIFMGFKSFHQRNALSYSTLEHGQTGAMLRSTVNHHVLPELGMEHVW